MIKKRKRVASKMVKKWLLLVGGVFLTLIALVGYSYNPKDYYDIVIYGGGPQAVATALKASDVTYNQKKILMIVPENVLGSVLTAGGQNLLDTKYYQPSILPPSLPQKYYYAQGGSMYLFYQNVSEVFSVQEMESELLKLIQLHPNIEILFAHDIIKTEFNHNRTKIAGVDVQSIHKDNLDRYIYGKEKPLHIRSDIFIDASESGKLTSLSGNKYTIGRENLGSDKKQMSATFMFKVKGIDVEGDGTIDYKNFPFHFYDTGTILNLRGGHEKKHDPTSSSYANLPRLFHVKPTQAGEDGRQTRENKNSPFHFYYTRAGSMGLWGGHEMEHDPAFASYANQSTIFRLKPYNAGEDGYSGEGNQIYNTEFWLNTLLVYNVDGRKLWRDKVAGNGLYPEDGGMDPTEARELAIEEIQKPAFIQLLKRLYGFKNVELVYQNGKPMVADMMYIRETIHSTNRNGSFALNREDTRGIHDERHYSRRIGLGFYNFDSNSYDKTERLSEPDGKKPWYVPYDVLVGSRIKNLLVPGYAANIDSYSWRAMRVYPNLIVLGDAAGVAAGLSSQYRFNIFSPTPTQIMYLQKTLEKEGVILNK